MELIMNKYCIGIPKETKPDESRVALIPSDIINIKKQSLYTPIYVQRDAGTLAGYTNEAYTQVGAILCDTAEELYDKANFIVKVKEPNHNDLKYITAKHILFCYFHLAADPDLTKKLLEKRITAIAFESMVERYRYGTTLPLLEPMSKIAGKLSIHMAHDILRTQLKQLITEETNVHVVGAGNVGFAAAKTAAGLGAQVFLYDALDARLNDINATGISGITTMPNLKDNPDVLTKQLTNPSSKISVVVCGALVRDDKAPKLITKETLDIMSNAAAFRPTVFVDVSIDQGGCIEGITQTSLSVPYYKYNQHFLVAVPNMPGAVSNTSSRDLSNCVWPYAGLLTSQIDTMTLHLREDLVEMFETLNSGIILRDGKIVNETLKQLYGTNGEKIA